MSKAELIKTYRDRILAAADRYHAHDVRLFGSVARGQETDQSDVDLLVKFDSGATLLDHSGLIAELQRLLGCTVDVAPEDSLRPQFRQQILAEAVPL